MLLYRKLRHNYAPLHCTRVSANVGNFEREGRLYKVFMWRRDICPVHSEQLFNVRSLSLARKYSGTRSKHTELDRMWRRGYVVQTT